MPGITLSRVPFTFSPEIEPWVALTVRPEITQIGTEMFIFLGNHYTMLYINRICTEIKFRKNNIEI